MFQPNDNVDTLFSRTDLREMFQQQFDALKTEIEQLDANRFLNTSPNDLAKYFVENYSLETPKLRRDEMAIVGNSEIKLTVKEPFADVIAGRSNLDSSLFSDIVPGQRIEIEIPFDGESQLFYARASTYSSVFPRAQVKEQSLLLIFEIRSDSQKDILFDTNRTLDEIKRYLDWTRNDVKGFNTTLLHRINSTIEERRQRILTNQQRVASLEIPLKIRTDAPKTYAVPSIKRKIAPELPTAPTFPYEPEPVLEMEHYEHVLKIIQSMTQVMERSPSAFETMKEENLRQHFLVQLNGQFEGKATGETFNMNGKTDILLRENNRNVFIAECKFWKGAKQYQETIDQLLGYTAWRDTKTAILIFNRDTTMTTVLDSVKAETEKHANYKRTLDWKHETGFRYVFHQNDDKNRELILTVLVFDIPSIKKLSSV
jgi:hypothetical protein